jgi:hypothetical protein
MMQALFWFSGFSGSESENADDAGVVLVRDRGAEMVSLRLKGTDGRLVALPRPRHFLTQDLAWRGCGGWWYPDSPFT